MSRYVFAGTSRNLGRHGFVPQGTVLDLNAEEVASIQGNDNFFEEPTPSTDGVKHVADSATLAEEDDGKIISVVNSAAIELTLPADPDPGYKVEIYHAEGGSGDDITVEPGDHLIQGGDLTNKVDELTVTDPGDDYASVPTVEFSGGGGTGAAATARMRVGTVDAIAAAGTGYAPGDTITLAGGTSSQAAVLTVSSVQVDGATIAGGGTGYTVDDILTVVGGTGTAATLRVTSVAGGVIDGISVESQGNYTVRPANPVAVTGGTGTGATFNLTWEIFDVTVTTRGNYSAIPADAVTQASTSGAGTGATFNLSWGVLSLTKTNSGENYATAPTIAIAGGTAEATASIAPIGEDYTITEEAGRAGFYFNASRWAVY